MRRLHSPIAALALAGAAALASAPAHALFSDDEARRAIIELRGRVELQNRETDRRFEELAASLKELASRLEQLSKGQLELQNQIETLRQELSRLRGQIEVQNNEIAQLQRRERESFAQLDTRLKQFEPMQVQLDGKTVNVDREEQRSYDAALALLRAGDFAPSIIAFQQFRSRYPSSPYTPSVLFWTGSAQFALKDYKTAIATLQQFLARSPENARAPDALLTIGFAQIETGDRRAGRRTLETVVEKYPESTSAQLAKDRIATLR